MSRPKPKVLLEITNKKTYKTEQVLDADAIWAVFYQDRPINLKTNSIVAQQVGPKYKKVSFSNPGHAINLAKKLNMTDSVLYQNFGNLYLFNQRKITLPTTLRSLNGGQFNTFGTFSGNLSNLKYFSYHITDFNITLKTFKPIPLSG